MFIIWANGRWLPICHNQLSDSQSEKNRYYVVTSKKLTSWTFFWPHSKHSTPTLASPWKREQDATFRAILQHKISRLAISRSFWSVWPDLAKFRHFGDHFKIFGIFLERLFHNWQNLYLIWPFLWYWANVHCLNGQILNK